VLSSDPDRPEGDADADAVVLGPSEAILLLLA
jgi:hypothetical protein